MRILTADVGGTMIKVALVDTEGRIVNFQEVPTEGKLGGEHVMAKLIRVLEEYSGYDALAISTAGQVDGATGSIVFMNDNIPGYTGMAVKKILEERFAVEVRVENDVNCAALGESAFGAGQDAQVMLMLTYGTGVGGAMVFSGKLFAGAEGLGGEFGHMILHPEGERCSCGKVGCYEAYASTSALLRGAQRIDPTITSGKDFFLKVEKGDPHLLLVLDSWAEEVSTGLVSLIHIFNPDTLILGGGILEQPKAHGAILEKVREKILPSFSRVKILPAKLGNQAGLLGAAALYPEFLK